jgi:hypothetical protein
MVANKAIYTYIQSNQRGSCVRSAQRFGGYWQLLTITAVVFAIFLYQAAWLTWLGSLAFNTIYPIGGENNDGRFALCGGGIGAEHHSSLLHNVVVRTIDNLTVSPLWC